MNRLRKFAMASTCLFSLACTPAAFAHTADPDAPDSKDAAAQEDHSGDDIVVTALRRDSTLQTTPLSIAAVTGEGLRETGATGIQDYFRQVPSLNLTQGGLGQSRISIRGINTAGEATVGLYYDETPVTGPNGTTQDAGGVAANLNLFDVERVEVLRGPQGTLYGSSSMAGTVRVIFNKPDATRREAAIEGQLSSTSGGSIGYFVKAMVNQPIVEDVLAIRIAAYHEERPGFIDNVRLGVRNGNASTSNGIRGLIALTPNSDMNLTATVIYQKSKADDQQGWYEAIGRNKTDAPAKLPFDSEFELYNLTYNWTLPTVTLTATGSYYRYDILRSTDFTPSYLALRGNASRCRLVLGLSGACTPAQITQYNDMINGFVPVIGWQPASLKSKNVEVRASSNGDGLIGWTIGGYYEDRKDHIESNTSLADPVTGDVFLPLRNRAYRYVETMMTQKAAFAELSLRPLEGLTLTAGTRYYDYKKTVQGQNIQGDLFFASFPGPFSSVTANANGWLYKFNASYQATSDLLLYATASKGFRPGGANNIPTLPAALVGYAPDSLWSYEAGVKSSWLDNKLTVNLSAYQIDWSGIQTSARTADGVFGFITNAGAARIRGGELEMTVRPATHLVLTGGVGYIDAKLTEDQANSSTQLTGTTGRDGDRLPNVPRWTVSASAAYTVPVSADADLLLRADWAYTGKMQNAFRAATDPYFERYGNYHSVNLRVGIENDSRGLYLFAQNLTNEVGITGASSGLGFDRQIYTIAPRTFGINGRVSF